MWLSGLGSSKKFMEVIWKSYAQNMNYSEKSAVQFTVVKLQYSVQPLLAILFVKSAEMWQLIKTKNKI